MISNIASFESQNESIKQQNCNMLSSLENIENNSVLCAQYAELAANYFGQVLAQGKTSDVLNDPQVIKAYLGE